MKKYVIGIVASMIIGNAIAIAQENQAEEAPEQNWGKICFNTGQDENCNVRYTLYTQQGQLVVGVNLATRKGSVNRRIFQVVVPSWRSIPPGIKMQIDDGKENILAYSACLPNRCHAELPLSDELLQALKQGGKINFVSTNFRNKQNAVSVSLNGFTKAYDGPPLKEDEVEAQQKKLEGALKKKAEETRRKLKEAQDKAKSGG